MVDQAITDLGGPDPGEQCRHLEDGPAAGDRPGRLDLTFAIMSVRCCDDPGGRQGDDPNGQWTIINMASMGGKVGGPNQPTMRHRRYVISLTQVAKELAFRDHGELHLSGLRAHRNGAATHRGNIREWSSKSPLGRLAETPMWPTWRSGLGRSVTPAAERTVNGDALSTSEMFDASSAITVGQMGDVGTAPALSFDGVSMAP